MVRHEVSRVVPELGLGDEEAAVALAAALRAIVHAPDPAAVVDAVTSFVTRLGGLVVSADEAGATALPVDLALGAHRPLLADAEPLSVARMRLEQSLPWLVEDARLQMSRLHRTEELQRAAGVDPVTGLMTRRRLMRALGRARSGDVLAVLDVDDFKAVNDTSGHPAGDRLLTALGELLRATTRSTDAVGRYGGDELVVLFAHIAVDRAALRLRQAQARWSEVQGALTTFSVGAAPVTDAGWRASLDAADAALYDAKRSGKGRVVVTGVTAA